MQKWLQDKKNLPIVIAIVVILVAGAGFFVFSQLKGDSSDTTASSGQPATGAPAPDAAPQMGGPTAPGGPTTAPPAPGMAPVAPAPGAAPGAAGAPGAAPAGGKKIVARPVEAGSDDPFLPLDYKAPVKGRVVKPILRVPSVPRVFLPPPPKPIDWEKLLPQPNRRVAGIVYSQRVSALLQTPDGWETVRPGDKLRDGTYVERIERDRVVLRTTDRNPRQLYVKLAAAALQPDTSSTDQAPITTPTYRPGYPGYPAGGIRAPMTGGDQPPM